MQLYTFCLMAGGHLQKRLEWDNLAFVICSDGPAFFNLGFTNSTVDIDGLDHGCVYVSPFLYRDLIVLGSFFFLGLSLMLILIWGVSVVVVDMEWEWGGVSYTLDCFGWNE